MYELVDPRQQFIVKANTIIQKSRFSLSLVQQKVLLFLISKIQPSDTDFKEYEFSISDFCRCVGIEEQSGKNYKDVKLAIKGIRDKSLWLELEKGKSSLVAWIEKARINEGSGTIQIRLDSDLKPYLLMLKDHYTQYQMIYTLRMKSKYSLRLYELIKSYHLNKLGTNNHTFSVDELKRLLDAEKYVRFCNFHSDVLKIAVSEINTYSDLELSYKQITKGRKTISIDFQFRTKDTLERLRIEEETDRELGTNQLALF